MSTLPSERVVNEGKALKIAAPCLHKHVPECDVRGRA